MTSSASFTSGASSGIIASPQLLAQGAGFFAQSCADCHGDDAHGDEGPDLHNLAISNARIAAQIKNGTKDQMPSFSRKYNEAQVAALVAYVRSLR
ncbi:MAG: c-type cytochrome [Chthoniobacteraceae bacterium]